jgi:hypothetical protein
MYSSSTALLAGILCPREATIIRPPPIQTNVVWDIAMHGAMLSHMVIASAYTADSLQMNVHDIHSGLAILDL